METKRESVGQRKKETIKYSEKRNQNKENNTWRILKNRTINWESEEGREQI